MKLFNTMTRQKEEFEMCIRDSSNAEDEAGGCVVEVRLPTGT